MFLIGSLVTQQISVGTGTSQERVPFGRTLAYRERNSLFGEFGLYRRHRTGKPGIILHQVLTALQHKGIEPQSSPFAATSYYFILAQAVTHCTAVAAPQATITAIVTAIGAYLYERAHIDPLPETGLSRFPCTHGKILPVARRRGCKEHVPHLFGNRFLLGKHLYKSIKFSLLHICMQLQDSLIARKQTQFSKKFRMFPNITAKIVEIEFFFK